MDEYKLMQELIDENYLKSRVKNIASKYGYKESELKRFYSSRFFIDIAKDIDLSKLSNLTLEYIEEHISEGKK